ncbi:hypothetical protein Tco_0057572 [Tanacetum coccineum]
MVTLERVQVFKKVSSELVSDIYRQRKLVRFLSSNQANDIDSDVEEDTKSSSEFLANLNAEIHDGALLANHKRFYKRSEMDEESVSSEGERVNKVKAFMAIPEDEPSVGKERKHFLDYTHVDLYYVGDQMKNLLRKFNSLNEELSSCKSKLNDLKNTKSLNCSLQNEIIRLNLENDSLKDEINDLKNVIEKWTSSKVTLDQLLTEQVPGNIVRALGGRGKKKDIISSKEVLFSKATESPSETILKISSNSESKCDNLELFPPLPKLTRVEPIGTSVDVLTLSDLTLTPAVFEELKKFPDKKSAIKALKKKTQTMSPSVLYPIPFKKANSSTEQLLLTLMEEVKGLKEPIKIP